ncbi:MAG: metallophosphoesterase [Pseudomonadota bacterium]
MPAWIRSTLSLTLLLGLAACGGGAGTEANPTSPTPTASASCDPAEPATHGECGSVILGLTDADGDFLSYTVDVVSLTLETANGRIVETLPRRTRIDFTEYVDLTELLTTATVPPASYVAGSITLDYSDAEIVVEEDGAAREAVVIDAAGTPLTQNTLTVELAERDRLVVTRGRTAFLQLDFDLEASHRVDLAPEPALATAEVFIVAEVSPVDEKTLRVRGPVQDVDADGMNYTVSIRPFHLRDGDFGRVTVNTTDTTEFEIDDVQYTGAAGIEALAAAQLASPEQAIPSVALGSLDLDERSFTAERVLAGSSVPGTGLDAVTGNVIARDGNFLTVRGATLVPAARRAHFHDNVVVELGEDTKVFRDGAPDALLGIADISIGQRLRVRGVLTDASADPDAAELVLDATEGYVRLQLTRLSGLINSVLPGEAVADLQGIDRRRVALFDFSGTGMSPAEDADSDNYQIATQDLSTDNFAPGQPFVAKGFPTAFGTAAPDFSARTLIDFTGVRSKLGIGWGEAGTVAPFQRIDADGLVLDNQNPAIGERKFIKQGPVLIDLTELPSGTTLLPPDSGRTLYSIKSSDSIRLYTDFAEFVGDLSLSLDGATAARSLHARGQYDAETNVFTANKIGIFLLDE